MDKVKIDLKEGQRVWFTSDLHFGHRNVIKFCDRPFKNVQEMGKALIENWNTLVSEDDTVFVLGDFAWSDSNHDIQKILGKLKGKIYLILGNHDTLKGFRELPEHVTLLGDEAVVWIIGLHKSRPGKVEELYLSHCPMMSWPHRTNGVPNLFGHIHSGPRTKAEVDQDLPLWAGQQYDVGVDNNEYFPIEVHDIYTKLRRSLE